MKKILFTIAILLSFVLQSQVRPPTKFEGGVVIGKFTEDPTGFSEGQIYWNETSKKFRQYNGLIWEDISSIPTIDNLASTQTIILGEIGTTPIETAFNNHTFTGLENPVQNQEDGYVLINALNNGFDVQYLFNGVGGSYGVGGTAADAIEEDFTLLEEVSAENTTWMNTAGTQVSTNYNQPIRHAGEVRANSFVVEDATDGGIIRNRRFGNLLIQGYTNLILRGANPNNSKVLVTSNGAIQAYDNDRFRYNLDASRNYSSTVPYSGARKTLVGIGITDNVRMTTATNSANMDYAALYINPNLVAGTEPDKIFSIFSNTGNAVFNDGSFTIGNLAAPTGLDYMVTVDDTGLLSREAIPSGGGGIQSIVGGTNITVDATDPENPVVNASSGGSPNLETVIFQDGNYNNIYTRPNFNGRLFVEMEDSNNLSRFGVVYNEFDPVEGTAYSATTGTGTSINYGKANSDNTVISAVGFNTGADPTGIDGTTKAQFYYKGSSRDEGFELGTNFTLGLRKGIINSLVSTKFEMGTISAEGVKVTVNTPSDAVNNEQYFVPLTVNGTKADSNGNITVSTGGGTPTTDASLLTSGVLADGRVQESNVTQYLGNYAQKGTRLTANISGATDLDWGTTNQVFEYTLTADASLSDVSLPQGVNTKVIELLVTGDFVLTIPSTWTALPNNDAYNGLIENHIIVSCINGNSGTEKIIYSLTNL